MASSQEPRQDAHPAPGPAAQGQPSQASAAPPPAAGKEPAPRVDQLGFDHRGLVPVVVQELRTGQVLMLAYANGEALTRTLEEGRAWFFSRSRRRLWRKGETSGHQLVVREVWIDCDADAVLYRVEAQGPACHTGQPTCFYRRLAAAGGQERDPSDPRSPGPTATASAAGHGPASLAGVTGHGPPGAAGPLPSFLARLEAVVADRRRHPASGSYTASLLAAGLPRILQKVGEEAVETVVAGGLQESQRLVAEVADLVYHLTVLLAARDLSWTHVADELARRAGGRT